MRRGFEEICKLAETASASNLDSEEGYEAFWTFAHEVVIREEKKLQSFFDKTLFF